MSDRGDYDTDSLKQYVRDLSYAVVGWLLVAAGIVALVVGWFGVSREALVAKQLPYLLSGGLGGLALVVVGAVLIGAHDLRRFGGRVMRLDEKLTDLHEVLLVDAGEAPSGSPSGSADDGGGPGSDSVVALDGGEKYHEPGCAIVQGKDGARQISFAVAHDDGLEPCKLCEPAAVRE